MNLELQNQTALVTASTAGIGLATATTLAREQARVIVNGRTDERVRAGIEAIRKAVPNARVEGVAADLATAAGAQRVIDAFPEVDILVNNAGLFLPSAFEEIKDGDWAHLFEINLMSGVRLSRHYLPKMLSRNRGRIIFVASESGVQPPVDAIHYGTMKAGVIALARGLAERTRGTTVTVNSVLPGPTASEAFSGAMTHIAGARGMSVEALEREFFTNVRPTSLLARFATPDEVANMIAYLSSPLAIATNGAAIRVEGGVLRNTL